MKKKLNLIVVLALLVAACSSSPESSPATSGPGTSLPETSPEDVALSFLEAKASYDTDSALALVDDEATVGVGPANSKDELAFEIAFSEATGLVVEPVGCDGVDGVLNCTAEATTAITRARGLEPDTFTYDIEVNDDLITTVRLVGLDGYSSKNWTPFQSWIRQNHPDDYGVMYEGPSAIAVSDESLVLWESRTAEYIGQLVDGPKAVAAVTDAYAAWSAGDVDGYIDALAGEEREGAVTWRAQLEADSVAKWSITFPDGCTYEGIGAEGHHVVDCYAVTTSDLYDAMGIIEEGNDTYYLNGDMKIVGWDSFNETNAPGEFDVELVRWLYDEHPEIAAEMKAGPANWWDRTPEDMAIVLDYVEEFVAQSDVYPITP